MHFIILLTGCINPNGMLYTKLTDANTRKSQYVKSIMWYLSNTDLPIVFVENSGVDISDSFPPNVYANRLEILTFCGNDYSKERGKGYGEAIIIEYALNHSRIINSENFKIVKITGRLIIKNINEILLSCKKNNVVIANINNDDWGSTIANSQMVVGVTNFWKNYFLKNKEKLDDSKRCYFEHILWESIITWKKNGGLHSEFFVIPQIIGVSGTSGNILPSMSKLDKIKYYIMYFLHKNLHYYGFLNPFYKGKR